MDLDLWTKVRRAVLVDGKSKRSVSKEFGIHFKTLQKMLDHSEPPGYRRTKPRRETKIEPFLDVIQEILKKDADSHKKQRHTAKRIYERLRDEHGFTGGYTIVKDAVREYRNTFREAFIPLRHPPGEAQVDFGYADAIINSNKEKIAIFVMTLPYSNAVFAKAYPRECMEAFHDGHVNAFRFFGGVPKRITYDNLTLAVQTSKPNDSNKRKKDKERTYSGGFKRLLSHFLFEPHFCNVREPQEKGSVENYVGYVRKNFLVPVPEVRSLSELNSKLEEDFIIDQGRTLRGKTMPISELLEDDRAKFIAMPKMAFETRRIVQTRATGLSLVRFDRNDYSVPTKYAHCDIIAAGSIEKVKLYAGSSIVAWHRRSWEKEKVFYSPIHYLALLAHKPGGFDYARPLEDWNLPECFNVLRRRLEAEQEGEGTKKYISVLRLLEKASIEQLRKAIEFALSRNITDYCAINVILDGQRERIPSMFSLDGRPHLSMVRVSAPNIGAYALLLKGGDS